MKTIMKSSKKNNSPKKNNLPKKLQHASGKPKVDVSTPPELADKYTFIEELGHGTQGHVYLAKRNLDGTSVAIKQLRIDSVQTWKEYDLFMREAKTLQSIQYAGIAKFYEALEFLDIPHPAAYIVQEYIDGRSLGDMIQSGYRFSMQRVFACAERLTTILKNLHSHTPPIIHRDIKPSNILFKPIQNSDAFELYLIDFGAVANPQVQSGGSTVAGTFGYMPPEQLMGKPTPASDIYALGAMIAYMLSGVEPANMQVADFRLVIDPHLQNVPRPVVATLRQMLSPNAANRLCDYDELAERFHQYAANHFDKTQAVQTNALLLKHNAQLQKVKAYNQEGNMELWDKLPDQTPRAIPATYADLNPEAIPSSLSLNETAQKLMKPIFINDFKFILFVAIFLNTVMSMFLIIAIINEFLTLFIFSFIFIFAGAFLSFCAFTQRPSAQLHEYTLDANDFHLQIDAYQSRCYHNGHIYHNLITNGRKTVATIVDISYKSIDHNLLESFHFTEATEVDSTNAPSTYRQKRTDHLGFYCHQSPAFTIRYKFNPPDDSSPYDLIHEVTTISDCEDKLKPGDLISILYYINPKDNREVFSTPYPIPYQDFGNYDNIMGHSKDIV